MKIKLVHHEMVIFDFDLGRRHHLYLDRYHHLFLEFYSKQQWKNKQWPFEMSLIKNEQYD